MRTPQLPLRGRSFARLACAAAAAVAFILASSGTALAATSDEAFARLLELNPGLSAAELEESMQEAAAATGLTYDEAITTALGEAESQAPSDGSVGTSASDNPECSAVALGKALFAGDIFWSASSTNGVSHGHMGIFSDVDRVTEARGPGESSDDFPVQGREYCKNIEKMDVNTTVATQAKAGAYAVKHLTGKPYSSNFAWNKGSDIDSLNCSELVYKAYKRSVDIDLDGNGGLGVYPNDIKNSSKTTTYEIIDA